mgnify:CR=1 FL=1
MASSIDKSIADKLEAIAKSVQAKNANANIEQTETRSLTDNTVTKSNALSRAYYRFSLSEKRIMESLISRLHPMRSDNDIQDISLSAADFSKAYGLDKASSYRDLSTAAHGLMRKVITTTDKGYPVENSLMSQAQYMKDEGRIVCTLDSKIVPHLIQMRERFNSYPLAKAANFRSGYTWRFYEILVSWAQPKSEADSRFYGWFQEDIKTLRKMLGVPDSYGYGQFKKTVLDRVIEELYNKANITLKLETQKTGRKITSFNITFMENDQLKLI